ncbi:uncharacterized protein DEA37_0006812 [Paragonimus westermani]|uniref:Uncharacterized protein n=1 Tax=Paragonimus westermani TaxID=34504 RepID=A0A5J4N6N3_9TREM|nr:uncharacterized protein DEA37_0006812 [Paragonimus westermani]
MVRLVFRCCTHVRRSICTSKSLWSSTRVSSGFNLCNQSSPSFGSQHIRPFFTPTVHWSKVMCLRHGTGWRCACCSLLSGTMRKYDRMSPQSEQVRLLHSLRLWVSLRPLLTHMLLFVLRVSRRVRWIVYHYITGC